MDLGGFGRVLRAALLAGLVAGALIGSFHLFFTEPAIDAAIALEEQAHAQDVAMPPVSRELQRVGLVLGFVLYGLSFGVLFSGIFWVLQRLLPFESLARRGMALAGIAYWSVALVPFLKYPANPPGVGEPETIYYRQALSLGLTALVLLGVALSFFLPKLSAPSLGASSQGGPPWWALVIANIFYAALLYILMPANPDPVAMPEDLMLRFRLLSLAGLTLFWAIFGGIFGFVGRDGPGAPERPNPPPVYAEGRLP